MSDVNVAQEQRHQKDESTGMRRWYASAAVLACCAVGAGLWAFSGADSTKTEDAYVDGNAVQITSQVSGTVTAINADNTDHVDAGAPLIRLNGVDAEIQFERAKAALAKATRNARIEYSQVQQLNAEVVLRSNDVARAEQDFERRSKLAQTGAVTLEEVSHAQDALKNAKATLDATVEQSAQRKAMVDGTTIWTHPDVLLAAANLRDAYVALKRTEIRSPVEGTVTKRSVQVGQRISPGVSLMTVVPLNTLWVNANFKESQLSELRVGQPADLRADVYGGSVTYHGKVVGLDAGTGSAFSLLPAQNATGNWIKVTQRVPVRIALDPAEVARHPLQVGLSMHVAVDTSNRSGERIRRDRATPDGYQTSVFNQELESADAVVKEVILANSGSTPQSAAPLAMKR